MDCDNADDDNNDDDEDGTILIRYPSNKRLIFFYNKTQTCHARLKPIKYEIFYKNISYKIWNQPEK